MSRQYTLDSKMSSPQDKRLGNSILSQFYLELQPHRLRSSPKHQLISLSPNLICHYELPVTSELLDKPKYSENQSHYVATQTDKKADYRYDTNLYEADLTELMCQKEAKIKKYRHQINVKNYQLGQINAMFQNYVALNKTLLNQCKQKINYFEEQVKNFSEHSSSMIQQIKEKYNCELKIKNQNIARLQSQVKAQEYNIYKLNLRVKDSVDVQRNFSPLTGKFTKHNKKISQISFGDQNLKQQKKREQILNKNIIDLKQQNKRMVQQLEDRIAQKQETIRKMAQFNTDICQLFLKERQNLSFSTIRTVKIVKESSTSIEPPSQEQASSKDSELFRAKSQKQIDHIMEKYEIKISSLQQESSYIKKQYIQIQRENQLIKQYLDLANQQIKKLQRKLNDKQNEIEELLKKDIQKPNQQKDEFMLFFSNSKQGMLNSDVISSVDQPLNDDKSKIGNSLHSQQTIKRELVQGIKQFSIQQISEVSFQFNKTQKILKSPNNPKYGLLSTHTSNKNSSQQQEYFYQEKKINRASSKEQLMRQKYQVQRSKATTLQQLLNTQRQLNRILRAKIKSMQGQSTDSKITDKNFRVKTDPYNQADSPVNKQSISQIKQAICNILMILQKKDQNNQNDSLQSNVNQKESVVDLKKAIRYHLNKVSKLSDKSSSKKDPFVQALHRVKPRTRYFVSPKKSLSINPADTVTSIILNSP